MEEVTRILSAIEKGDLSDQPQLVATMYTELRRLAARKLSRERPGDSLQATDLVHEAFVRLTDKAPDLGRYPSRSHFFAAAAEAMRRILVERARRKARLRHGGHMRRIQFQSEELSTPCGDKQLLEIDECLGRLEQEFPDKATVVKLRYFAGLSNEETAALMGISTATVQRYWTFARAWLFTQLET